MRRYCALISELISQSDRFGLLTSYYVKQNLCFSPILYKYLPLRVCVGAPLAVSNSERHGLPLPLHILRLLRISELHADKQRHHDRQCQHDVNEHGVDDGLTERHRQCHSHRQRDQDADGHRV